MTARDEKWESAFNHLHGLSKLTRTIKFLENEGERAKRMDLDLATRCVEDVNDLLVQVEVKLATARALDYHAHRAPRGPGSGGRT